MYRPYLHYNAPSHRGRHKCARALLSILVWISAVALSLRYGFYGNYHVALGPNSSRMMETGSVFVKELQVRDKTNKGLMLYGFAEHPELRLEANWTVLKHLFVDSYERQGFSMWLNKGSRIRVAWMMTYGGELHGDLLMVLMKGEKRLEEVERRYNSYITNSSNSSDGNSEAEYVIEEDNSYYIGVMNMNPRTILMSVKVNVSAKMYDTSTATSNCSTTNGLCKLKLNFPRTQFFVLTTPDYDGPFEDGYVEISYTARLITYLLIIGSVAVILYLIIRRLEAWEPERIHEAETAQAETEPILPRKEIPTTYGTNEEDPDPHLCCNSDDLYDQKICVVCYDGCRNCFFTPCGHSATCFTCAQRIMQEENKVCPICRRLIHKVRKLVLP